MKPETPFLNPARLKTETEALDNHEKSRVANDRLREIARLVGPEGLDYVGSTAIHAFRKEGLRGPIYFFIDQIIAHKEDCPPSEDRWSEDAFIAGLATLRDKGMMEFGRTPPAKRKDL